MQYVMVQNEGQIPVNGIRLLGQSSKSENQIGMFGTGLKETIALGFRRGVSIVICSGSDVIKFVTKAVDFRGDTAQEIGYTINDGEFQPMNITTDFGKQDWTCEWQMLREVFSNAYDEGGLHHEVTDQIQPKAGATRVYLEATFDLLDEYHYLPKKMLWLTKREPLASGRGWAIYPKTEGMVYKKGVWVKTHPDLMYDYELTDVKLTESRSADMSSYEEELARMVCKAPWKYQLTWLEFHCDPNTDFSFEIDSFLRCYSDHGMGRRFARNFERAYPKHALRYPTAMHHDQAQAVDWKIFPVPSDFDATRFKHKGFPDLPQESLVIEQLDYEGLHAPVYLARVSSVSVQANRILVPSADKAEEGIVRWYMTHARDVLVKRVDLQNLIQQMENSNVDS